MSKKMDFAIFTALTDIIIGLCNNNHVRKRLLSGWLRQVPFIVKRRRDLRRPSLDRGRRWAEGSAIGRNDDYCDGG
jgi:hypothetical protein